MHLQVKNYKIIVSSRSLLERKVAPLVDAPVVKTRIQQGLLDFAHTGISILEAGHRSKEFLQLMKNCETRIRRLFEVPSNYHVLLMQGGATGQFDTVPMNLFGNRGTSKADYLVTGCWSQKAMKEAKKYGEIREICPQVSKFTDIPSQSTWKFDPEAAYFYYCDNETINGLEFQDIPQPPVGVPIVCDMCSSLLSHPVDIARYGLIFAGSQKNMGCAGVTVVIVREDLVGGEMPYTPAILNYRMQVTAESVLNTPPTFRRYEPLDRCLYPGFIFMVLLYSIFAVDETLRWVEEQGGLEEMAKRTKEKSDLIYTIVDRSDGFYRCPAAQLQRSRVNIVLRLSSEALEKRWLAAAKDSGMVGLNGHRSVGGLRISLYNAITMDDVHRLITFMTEFMEEYKHSSGC
ncbi:phosphoserine aminotransferase [Paragonimus westermani]|uniref:phosphoserine transaminase n=1 Tax=Paragonimus westermani TaxID=34504 RepID=A0A5J4NHU4_9TREM|nr:phosphoserine aminotransferase [Paragonimus westermani]